MTEMIEPINTHAKKLSYIGLIILTVILLLGIGYYFVDDIKNRQTLLEEKISQFESSEREFRSKIGVDLQDYLKSYNSDRDIKIERISKYYKNVESRLSRVEDSLIIMNSIAD